jgi:hypothetical protein
MTGQTTPTPIRWWRMSALFVAVIVTAVFLQAFIVGAVYGSGR